MTFCALPFLTRNMLGVLGVLGVAAGLAAGFVGAGAAEPQPFGRWAAIVVAGDWRANSGNPTAAFENARRDVAAVLGQLGFAPGNVVQMSVRPPGDEPAVAPVTGPGIFEQVLTGLKLRAPEGCLLYFTSHGTEAGLALDDQLLTASQMRQLVRASCGQRPTILIVSACNSGIFAREALQGRNRMIVTAALPERSSFGCGEDDRYPYFDGCFIASAPAATDFIDLAELTRSCVEDKEARLDLPASEPQIVVGAEIEALLRARPFRNGGG